MEQRIMVFLFLLLGCSVLQMLHLHGQETDPGFISIDCGNSSEYKDEVLGLHYTTDDRYVDSGENMQPDVSQLDPYSINQQAKSLRSFPNGTRNCYTLRPAQGKNNTYLIRASFLYGNYDGKNQTPKFDLHIGVNYWATVYYPSFDFKEIIYVAPMDEIQVCLINTGHGVPYISTLVLRLLNNSIYQQPDSMSLVNQFRFNIGSLTTFRYPKDSYDRIWSRQNFSFWSYVNNNNNNNSIDNNNDAYKVPADVLKTAQIANNSNLSLNKSWESNITSKHRLYFHFVELQSLPNKQRREFNILFSNGQSIDNISLEYLKPLTIISPILNGSEIYFSITATDRTSQYPPLLNAYEQFFLIDHPNVPTSLDDVNAIIEVKKAYKVMIDSWQGDPCMPKDYIWEGLTCNYDDSPPRVVSLNLSSRMLNGDIARATSLSNLLALETLDMSHNQLTGQIPEFLGKLPNLRVLNLSGNNLSGTIPKTIRKKIADQSLNLSVSGNKNMCLVASCQQNNGFIIPVIIASVVVFLVALLAIIWAVRKVCQKKRRVRNRKENGQSGGTFKSKIRSFTYNEVLTITQNFTTDIIGKGGFGKVYLGTLDDGQKVAVKILSQSSKQGITEFKSEVQLLMVVHHRNLVPLVGYCNDSQNKVLIYEFMERGNVRENLSESNPNILTWSERVKIALDTAQGLDYLHNGCKPAIIHSDLKTSNILLTGRSIQAKIADFGLSKAFANESRSHISTCAVAGTLGYLDPEFQRTRNLTRKSDVYSFGIVLLELVTGRAPVKRNSEGEIQFLPQWVKPLIQSGDINGIVDPRLNQQFNIDSAQKVVDIAMSCVSQTEDISLSKTEDISLSKTEDISQVLSKLKECWNVEEEVVSGAVLDDSALLPR